MLSADNWCIKVADKVYGPYTSEQMRKYAHEGRLAADSLISPAGSRAWREAREESTFSSFFGYTKKTDDPSKNGSPFGRANHTTRSKPNTPNAGRNVKPGADVPEIQAANFILIFDVVSAAAGRVGSAVQGLGQAFRIADNVWAVNCELTAVGVRNTIAPYLNSNESIFVVDSTRGRSSWQNYAPAIHSKLTAAYASTVAMKAAS